MKRISFIALAISCAITIAPFPASAQCVIPLSAGFIGDSILAGTLVTTKPPLYVPAKSGHSWMKFNMAISGHTSADCLSDWTRNVRGKAQLIYISCGINSVHTGVAEATIESQLDQIATEADTDGIEIVWASITPCADYSGCSAGEVTALSNVNAHSATTCTSLGANCHFVDAYTVFKDSGSGIRDTCDYGDGLHLNEACTQEFGNLLAGATP